MYFKRPSWAPNSRTGIVYKRPAAYAAMAKRARGINLLKKFARLTQAVKSLQGRFRKRSFANRGATFMRSKYFKSYHRKWGMRP